MSKAADRSRRVSAVLFEINRFKFIAEFNSSGISLFVKIEIEITEYAKLRC